MPIVKPALAVLKDATINIKIGAAVADDFAPAVSNILITPTTSAATFQGVGIDASFTDQSTATWAVQLTYAQDWDSTKSLSRYLLDNEGKQAVFEFRPRDKSAGFSVTATITPGAIGGAVNGFPTSTSNMGVIGKPVPLTKLP